MYSTYACPNAPAWRVEGAVTHSRAMGARRASVAFARAFAAASRGGASGATARRWSASARAVATGANGAPPDVTMMRRMMPPGASTSFARAFASPASPKAVNRADAPLVESANAPDAPERIDVAFRDVLDVKRAVAWVKANARATFAESVDMSVHLGVDPKRSDMIVRGAVSLPHGTGKTVRVGVFAEGEEAEEARRAGAIVVGGDELIKTIKDGGSNAINFDACVGTPGMMPKMKEIARILGPRGLMPNPKLGTVTTDVGAAVKALLGGRVEFRAEKNAIVHAMVGKVTFEDKQLEENIAAVFKKILELRPKGKGAPNASKYLKKAYLSSTMGRGSAKMDLASLTETAAAYQG